MNGSLSIPDNKKAGSYQRPRLKPFVIGGAVLVIAFAAVAGPAVMKFGRAAQKDLLEADIAVAKFHRQLDEGSFDQIYGDSDDELKRATTQQKFVELLSAIHRKLCLVQSTEREGFFVTYGTSGERVRIIYSTQFEGDIAKEQFIFQVSGEDLRLICYDIRSDALIVK